jgi:alpha-tubulin suppressor-like RCC1 family protein
MRRRLFTLAALAVALLASTNAQAYWTSSGSGGGSGNAETLAAPTNVIGTPGAGTVTLSWSAVSPPGSGAVSYYVTRGGGNPSGNCPTSSAPTSVLTCTDSGLSAGTYSYTVTAVWHSWATASSPAIQVTLAFGALDHFVLAAATTTPTAGQADSLTITAKDAAGITVTTYTNSQNLTFSGASTIGSFTPTVTNSSGTATNFGTATAITFTNGVATVSGSANGAMILYKVETASIVVSDGSGHTSGAGLAVTVGPGAFNSFNVPTPTTQTAGTAFSVTLTAKDSYGNTATGYTGAQCIAFSGPSNSQGSNAPSYPAQGTCAAGKSSVAFTNGVSNPNPSITLYNAASTTLTATDAPSGKNGSTGAFTVNPLAISSFSLAAATTTPNAGGADNLTITALDQYGNTATSYANGSHNLTFSGATAIGTFTPNVTNTSGTATNFGTATAITFTNGVAIVSGSANGVMKLYKAETAHIVVSDGSHTNGAGLTVTVSAGAPSSFTIPTPTTRTAGTAFNVTLTATADAYGNAGTSYTGTKCITFSGPTASPNGTAPLYPAQGSCGAGQSAITFTSGAATVSITLYDATTSTTLTATDASAGFHGSTGAFAVNGLTTASTFVLTAATTTPIAGQTDALTITAGDTWGNTVTSYTGQHNLTFSGARAIGTYNPTVTSRTGTATTFGTATSITFTNGVSSAGGVMTLYRAQTASIVVTDGTSTNGSGLQVTVGPAALSNLALSAQKAVIRPGATDQLTIRAVDTYGNSAQGYSDGSHNVTFAGGTGTRTVTDSAGTPVNFSTATSITFANGVSTAGGLLQIGSVQVASITVSDGTHTSAPLRIVVSSVVATQVSAGGFHTCALRNDGAVECWGEGDHGELGNGASANSSSPVMVSNLTNVTQVSAGKYHTCALRNDGTVWCWGENQYGQLGNNSTTDSNVPVEVQGVGGTGYLTGVAEVSADGQFTCARLTSGGVRCWGHNQYGQVGNNTTNDAHVPVNVVGVGGTGTLVNVIDIDAGANQTCALISGGTVDCWGYNNDGQLGNGTTNNSSSPVQVLGSGGAGYLANVTAISGGRLHACALLSDHTVYCWGDNANGELGDGTTANRSTPVRAGTITTATSMSAGEYHSCATLSDGTAQCWGAAAFGQVGDGTTSDTSTPVTVIGVGGYGALSGIGNVSAGGGDISETDDYEQTCALMADGTVVSWGQNNYGQLGDGTTTMSISPVGVALL